ncbi:MAG: hypothetical protein FJ363_02315 [Gemmatimonadetes bacterium]|nr:hypothetical protein [Gemmatimonadota bacterium]
MGIAVAVLFAASWWRRAAPAELAPPAVPGAIAEASDTVSLLQAQAATQAALLRLDSLARAVNSGGTPSEDRQLSAADRQERDSLLTDLKALDAALDRAAKSPLDASYRALAKTAALRSLGAVSVLVDTLNLLDEVRRTLDPVAAPQREFAQLSERTTAIGASLQAIGQARRAALTRRLTGLGQAAGTPADADSARRRTERDSVRAAAAQVDSLLLAARQWHLDQTAAASAASDRRGPSVVALIPVLGALLLAGALVYTFTLALEAHRPTIAHAREAERVTGLPVLATIRTTQIPREGRARLQSAGGTDPFRMVYLSLTVGEPRVRTVCVTGENPQLVAATAGQLAASAAADERSTLVVDITSGGFTAAQHFGWKDEPGFSEAIAGVRLWREVATPIGASEGRDIDLVAAGASRTDTAEAIAVETNRREFLNFLGEHDFTVLVAATSAAAQLASQLAGAPHTVLVIEAARTRIDRLQARSIDHSTANVNLAGLLVFRQ